MGDNGKSPVDGNAVERIVGCHVDCRCTWAWEDAEDQGRAEKIWGAPLFKRDQKGSCSTKVGCSLNSWVQDAELPVVSNSPPATTMANWQGSHRGLKVSSHIGWKGRVR